MSITHQAELQDEATLMVSLGYASRQSFARLLMRAKRACLARGIQCEDHFLRQPDGTHAITRFGCYLVALHADPRKPEVAAAQARFAEEGAGDKGSSIAGVGRAKLAADLFRVTQIESLRARS